MSAPVPLRKRLRRRARYHLIRAALALVGALPISFSGMLGRALGTVAFWLAANERRKALASLAVAFPDRPEAERRALAKASFQHLGRCAFELACVAQLDRAVDRFIEWPEADRRALEAAIARGRGVVFVTGHVGNWELLARRVALAGFPAQSIARETSDAGTTALVERFRESGGVKSIWRGQEGAARAMLRALRAGEILGMVIDQDTKVQSVFVPFFGRLAATPRAPADLALRTGAALMVGFCQRKSDGRYLLTMKELPVEPSGDRERDVLKLTEALSSEIEHAIRRAPEQWVWMHQRWKTRPQSEGRP
ncbi:MAG: lysophospholipid acyltransferase family protein [Myxococcaceae bacterium]|nr:lysophospholipid acyltransferase family protein [Myxococcaceae bacterium]